MRKIIVLVSIFILGGIFNPLLANAAEPGKCEITIISNVHTYSDPAQATGPCNGLIIGYYIEENGAPTLIGSYTGIVSNGQQVRIDTPQITYGESILTVTFIKNQEPSPPKEEEKPENEQPEQPKEKPDDDQPEQSKESPPPEEEPKEQKTEDAESTEESNAGTKKETTPENERKESSSSQNNSEAVTTADKQSNNESDSAEEVRDDHDDLEENTNGSNLEEQQDEEAEDVMPKVRDVTQEPLLTGKKYVNQIQTKDKDQEIAASAMGADTEATSTLSLWIGLILITVSLLLAGSYWWMKKRGRA